MRATYGRRNKNAATPTVLGIGKNESAGSRQAKRRKCKVNAVVFVFFFFFLSLSMLILLSFPPALYDDFSYFLPSEKGQASVYLS